MMHEEVEKRLSMVQGIVDLFHPFVEGAVHDLTSGTLVSLFNNISERKVGEATPLRELKVNTDEFPDYFSPYYKTNWDGRKLKCISITVRDSQGIPVGLICLNLDVTLFEDLESKFSVLLRLAGTEENPVERFGGKWQEQTELQIEGYLKERELVSHRLSKEQKRDLVKYLYAKGVFNYKKAASFIAKYLNVSRASIYNYMKGEG
jgi:predicted transcriptional regulator YheO